MSEVPLKPIGREDIHRLESALMVATLFKPEVIEVLRDSSTRLTWVDSLAVAAGAIARSKAGLSVPKIAEELGRTEATVREHISGKTKAGQLILETYNWLVKSGGRFEGIPMIIEGEFKLLKKEELNSIEKALKELKEVVENLSKLSKDLETSLNKALESIDKAFSVIKREG